MKHFLLGTAGHVDHGKTSLIKALTQVDTDRLPEEKERGLSIDLGFAPLFLLDPDPQRSLTLGVVDVPGHQRFLRNMIAGVGGFDGVLLVVDPGEGVKPQTREHLAILNLLQTPRGVVVLSKADRYDDETLELARWEIAELLEGTFLEGAEMVATAVDQPETLEALRASLRRLFAAAEPRSSWGVARLPVDRVFSKTGFGSVVTGSLWAGTLRVGAELQVMPGGGRGKVRGLQVHGESVSEAVAGQRVALNLSGLEASTLARGATIVSPPGELPSSHRFGVAIRLLEPSPGLLRGRFRATFYQATGHALPKVCLLARDPEQLDVFGQLTFPEEVFLCPGDRFLLRDETDQTVIAGGRVLALDSKALRRRDQAAWLRRYENLAGGGQTGAVVSAVQAAGGSLKEGQLRKQLGLSGDEWEALKPTLIDSGRLRWVAGQQVWEAEAYDSLAERVVALLQQLQEAAPWKPGWRREELGKLLGLKSGRDDGWSGLLDDLVLSQRLARQGPLWSTADYQARLSGAAAQAAETVLAVLQREGVSPRDWEMILGEACGERKLMAMVEEHLLGCGLVERLTEKLVFSPAALEAARERLDQQAAGASFTASEAREWLETSRKYIIPVLEWMDLKGWTQRAGDRRQMRSD